MVSGLDMRFLGGKRRKKCKSKNNGKNKGDIQSLRPSDFAPAFGRAVGRCAAGLDAGLKPSSISEATARATAPWLIDGLHPTLRQSREGWDTRAFEVVGLLPFDCAQRRAVGLSARLLRHA